MAPHPHPHPHPLPQSQSQSQSPGPTTPCAAVVALARQLHLPLVPTDSNDNDGCCGWVGITCSRGTSPPAQVKAIAWARQSLQGNLSTALVPDLFAPLANALESLDLAGNPLLVGSLPTTSPMPLAQLSSLQSLSLANTGLSGTLPANAFPDSLQALDLSATALSGTLPALPRGITACNLAGGPNANYTCFSQPIPSACRNSLPASLPECPAPGPFDNFQWTSDVVILISASLIVTLALVSMIVVCYRWDRARDQAVLEKDQLLGELRRIRVQQAAALGTDPALEALGPQMARAAMVAAQNKRSSMASSSGGLGDGASSSATPSTPGATDPRASFTPSSAADPRYSFASHPDTPGMRVSYDPYDPRWSYPTPSTPGSAVDAYAAAAEARASYMSTSSSSYPVSPSTALWPHADAATTPSPTAAAAAARQSWPVAASSSASSSSPGRPWAAARGSASPSARSSMDAPPPARGTSGLRASYVSHADECDLGASISHPPPLIDQLDHAPPVHVDTSPEAERPKRHSMLAALRMVFSPKREKRMSAPPGSPALVTTAPLKAHDADPVSSSPPRSCPPSERDSWMAGRSILPPSVIEYRALDTLQHDPEGGGQGDDGDGGDSGTRASTSLVAHYPRSETAADAPLVISPPSVANDQGSSLRWLPSADHRLSVSVPPTAPLDMVVAPPGRHDSNGSDAPVHEVPPPAGHASPLQSPLIGHVVPMRVTITDVVTLQDVSEHADSVGHVWSVGSHSR